MSFRKRFKYILINLVSAILNLSAIYLLGVIVNAVVAGDNKEHIYALGFFTFIVTLVAALFQSLMADYYTIYKVGIEESASISQHVLKSLLNMLPKDYYQKEKTYYYNTVTNSAFAYASLLVQKEIELISSILLITIILIGTLIINKVMFLIFIGVVPITIFASRWQSRQLSGLQKNVVESQDGFLSGIKEIIDGKREINVLKQESYFIKKYHHSINKWVTQVKRFRFYEQLVNNTPNIIYRIYSIFYIVIAGVLVADGHLSVGMLVMGFQLIGYFANPVARINDIIIRLKANQENIQRVDHMCHLDTTNTKYLAMIHDESFFLKLNDFSLYTEAKHEKQLFNCKELTIKKNSFVVIKGANGIGKSMLLNYITGHLDTECGSGGIRIDDSIKQYAYLTYPLIFTNGSYHDNAFSIQIDKDIERLLRIDFEDDFIKTNPLNLSLGQQQKIALLRVLSIDSKVLILDEPLSNLDQEGQGQLVEYLKTIKGTKTIITIMHDNCFDDFADVELQIKDHVLR